MVWMNGERPPRTRAWRAARRSVRGAPTGGRYHLWPAPDATTRVATVVTPMQAKQIVSLNMSAPALELVARTRRDDDGENRRGRRADTVEGVLRHCGPPCPSLVVEVGSWAVSIRPLALRPRLATSLPFSTHNRIGAPPNLLEPRQQLFETGPDSPRGTRSGSRKRQTSGD